MSYFCTAQPLDELFSCLPFKSPSFGDLFSCWSFNSIFVLIFGEFFPADHLTLHPSISLASYFCATHSLGELFLHCPTRGWVIFLLTIWFSILWRVIFVLTIYASINCFHQGPEGGQPYSWEIDRLLLPEGRTFDENIFSQGGKIEHPRADLHLASFIKRMLSQFHWMKHVIRWSLLKLQTAHK